MPAATSRLLPCLCLLLLAACGGGTSSDAPPEISQARIVLPPPGAPMAAGYFEAKNPGPGALELRAVSSASFEDIQMHETIEQDGVSRMREVQLVMLQSGGTVIFEPGGKHLMLMGSRLAGETPEQITLALEFAAADGTLRKVEVPFAVESAGGAPAEQDPHAHHH